TDDGLKLIEIAAGLDLERDILANLAFQPIIADELKVTDQNIYQENWGGLHQYIKGNGSNK
ncbi:acyl CoA:acetate/3-ketoacid CoA transferase, partial [Staphylococcus aureus]